MQIDHPIIPELTCEEVFEKASHYTLIDVRRPEEFHGELSHITGAMLCTLGPELTQYLQNGDRNQDIVFICRSGARSASATLECLALGYRSAYNMIGGMIEWNKKSLPTASN